MITSTGTFPRMMCVRQRFDRPVVDNVTDTVHAELAQLDLAAKVKPGQTVAITAGSRGIANIAEITKAIVDFVRSLGGTPIIIPAMGSHGGATADGQVKLLATLGITPAYCGCEIRSSMETVVVCQAAEGFDVHFDKHAYQADHVIVCNRIKKHTDFSGDVQSGLMKMMLIGLGKHAGAKLYHRVIFEYGFPQILRSVANRVLANCPILCGLAILENGYDETAKIIGVPADQFESRERELLQRSSELMPSIPFEDIDLLIVDEMGKNISGTGMDTNVIGRKYNDHAATGDEVPRVKRIAVRGLTPETCGNGSGIGIAEFCLTRVIDQLDRHATMVNCVTSGHVTAGMLPLWFDTDAELMATALATIGYVEPEDAKVVWIRNTLKLDEFACSEALQREVEALPHAQAVGVLQPMPLAEDGMLPGVAAWFQAQI